MTFLFLSLLSCHSIKEESMAERPFIKNEDIEFMGDQRSKGAAIELLDKVLREQGDFGVYGNLSGGIGEMRKDMKIRITEETALYSIEISPKSTVGGHDFFFTIDKKTGKRSDITVGEVLPEPGVGK